MDGRWWDAEKLQYDEQPSVIYRPSGQLRIDYSGGHTRLRVPWPEKRLRWSGDGNCIDKLKMFGREWQVSSWEVDAERTWLNLVFSRALPISEIDPAAHQGAWRLRPASIDMAWAALERAVTNSVAQKSIAPIGRLRHCELIPLGYALVGLAESIGGQHPQAHERIETQLNALRYLLNPVAATHGRVPWRILPSRVRTSFLNVRRYPDIATLLDDVFDGLPKPDGHRTESQRIA
jgi:hypothetical protein